ncbi:MAG: SDR family NAD(P)-dependent oxidoreductase [Proteobacteria bacterium]|nr:SDR family NAD(P)-dependent oxidoreductase [Pseudomonadota bacterium]
MTEINDAVVLITGATGGFGRHMTQQFLAAGGRLILSDLNTEALASLKNEFGGQQDKIIGCIPADLSDELGCRNLVAAVGDAGACPDILINNAGLAVFGRLDQVPQDRWEQLMQVNLLAPIRLCSLFLPQMIARGSGHIVNISSLAGWVGSPGLTTYCAAKFGLRGFSEALDLDVTEQGICISTVYPSFSRTPILDSEQFGYAEKRVVPDDMLSDPADVVAAIVKGIRRNKKHIFPDPTARIVHYLQRFFPALMPILQRRMQSRTISPQ